MAAGSVPAFGQAEGRTSCLPAMHPSCCHPFTALFSPFPPSRWPPWWAWCPNEGGLRFHLPAHAPLLPPLSSPKQVAALVGLVPEMKLEVYSLKRQEKSFAGLAASVKDVFLKHADAQVGRAAKLWEGL